MRKNSNPNQSHPQGPRPNRPASCSKRANFKYHRKRCSVCKHPNREAIDEDFLRWQSPEKLALQYGIPNYCSIYRHVHATGLYARRRRAICTSLESIIEHAAGIIPTTIELVNAVETYAHFDSDGQLVEPFEPRITRRVLAPPPETSLISPKINRKPEGLEHDGSR
jgi:hypothetical protein